jgi:tripartite-type tricarboxylate transporter receptor subunit TctC
LQTRILADPIKPRRSEASGVVHGRLPYHPINDLKPVATTATFNFVLAVHPGLAARNVSELVAMAQARGRGG